jgi:hypothetical protein
MEVPFGLSTNQRNEHLSEGPPTVSGPMQNPLALAGINLTFLDSHEDRGFMEASTDLYLRQLFKPNRYDIEDDASCAKSLDLKMQQSAIVDQTTCGGPCHVNSTEPHVQCQTLHDRFVEFGPIESWGSLTVIALAAFLGGQLVDVLTLHKATGLDLAMCTCASELMILLDTSLDHYFDCLRLFCAIQEIRSHSGGPRRHITTRHRSVQDWFVAHGFSVIGSLLNQFAVTREMLKHMEFFVASQALGVDAKKLWHVVGCFLTDCD